MSGARASDGAPVEVRTIAALRWRTVGEAAALRGALTQALERGDRAWITAVRPPKLTLVPFRRAGIALISLGGEAAERHARARRLGPLAERCDAWDVETSVPVLGSSPPGAVLLTMFRRKRGLDAATFHHRWFHEHTPLTREIHPVVGYVRHAVIARVLGPSADGIGELDGIVTEDFARLEHLTTIGLFSQGMFGAGPRAALGAVRVARHISTFLDLPTIETYLVEPVHPSGGDR